MNDLSTTTTDEVAILKLLARLARTTDIGSIEEYCQCLTADVVLELPGAPTTEGIGQVRSATEAGRAARQVGPPSNTMHVLGGTELTVSGDSAEGVTAFTFLRLRDTPPVLHLAGRYYDSFRRTSEGWRLARRRIAVG